LDPVPGEITLLLHRWEDGESAAFDRLLPLVYPHLREVAAAYIGRERNPGVLQATALVHELYLRLLHQRKADWNDRSHFYTFAAKVMRMILTDHARANQAKKRGGADHRVPLNDEIPWMPPRFKSWNFGTFWDARRTKPLTSSRSPKPPWIAM
jgi:RNA polymerase sigma factor (TIGR02999 family)